MVVVSRTIFFTPFAAVARRKSFRLWQEKKQNETIEIRNALRLDAV